MTDARTLTLALPGGRWRRRYGTACCPAHGDRRPSLSIADGRDGRLLLRCHAGCDFRDILAALAGMGLVDSAAPARAPDPAEMARREAEDRAERERSIRRARHAWAEAGSIAGTLGARYLRARAIRAALPASLGFNPACWHGTPARRLPALVAAVTIEGMPEPVAVHRTYLAEPGRKADVEPNKAMLGPVSGGAVRLADGPGPLVVGEGIETALSLADGLATFRPSAWAALSAGGVAGLRLPARPGELAVAPDGDPAGEDAARRLADRAARCGWRVRIMPPPGPGLDWNDAARERARTPERGTAHDPA
ncbi:MAG: toprim domain-containing protein [Paracoccaceae bacterium]